MRIKKPLILWLRKLARQLRTLAERNYLEIHEIAVLWHVTFEVKGVQAASSGELKVRKLLSLVFEFEKHGLESLWNIFEFWSKKFAGTL